jgi:hypothetical protein
MPAAPPLPCMRRMRPCMRGGCRNGRQVVGYDAAGRVLNYSGVAAPTPAEIAVDAQKVGAPALQRPPGFRALHPVTRRRWARARPAAAARRRAAKQSSRPSPRHGCRTRPRTHGALR